MSEAHALTERRAELARALDKDLAKYNGAARLNYFSHQILLGGALLTSALAAIIGLWPSDLPKQLVGALAAASAALLGLSRQLALQPKANLHYRRATAIRALKRRLDFELPAEPTAEQIAAASRAWSDLEADVNQRWRTSALGPLTFRETEPARRRRLRQGGQARSQSCRRMAPGLRDAVSPNITPRCAPRDPAHLDRGASRADRRVGKRSPQNQNG